MSDLQQKLDNMSELDYKVITVADLVNKLAGLPPMLEVFVEAEGATHYLNDLEVFEGNESKPPCLILVSHLYPRTRKVDDKSYDEKLDEQRQKAMHMGAVSEESTKMHRRVE